MTSSTGKGKVKPTTDPGNKAEESMEILFCISGSIVFTSKSGIVPPVGSEVTIRTESYKKGMEASTILNFTVSEEFPLYFDYTADAVYIDVNNWEIFKTHGPD